MIRILFYAVIIGLGALLLKRIFAAPVNNSDVLDHSKIKEAKRVVSEGDDDISVFHWKSNDYDSKITSEKITKALNSASIQWFFSEGKDFSTLKVASENVQKSNQIVDQILADK